jgi:uroporphyrinogen-III synthase
MRVLVTRSVDDASRTARALAARGHEALIAPLYHVRFFDGPEISFEGEQAILVTSSNGARALARRTSRRDLPVFAVGTRTAGTARAEGFGDVFDAAGDAKALALGVRERLDPQAGALLHATGTNTSHEFARELARAGFVLRAHALYEAVEAPQLPANAAEALRSRTLDAMLLFSPRSALVFARRVEEAHLAASCRYLIACCISKAAVDALAGLQFRDIRVAPRPTLDSVLALLE